MKDERSRFAIRAAAVKRLLMWRYLSGTLPLYLVSEYPKSGGSWLCQMLSSYLELPFYRGRSPKIESSVMHGHQPYRKSFKNALLLVRDGRDVMVSLYYHVLFSNNRNSSAGVTRHRALFGFEDYDDIQSNLPVFLEKMLKTGNGIINHPWHEFNGPWLDAEVTLVKYEDLLTSPLETMNTLLQALNVSDIDKVRLSDIVAEYSFDNQRKKEGSGNSFLRSGKAGGWKPHFNAESRQIFANHAGEHLVRLGYETSLDWADEG